MSEEESQCELCQRRYHLFRRKKRCDSCGQCFCSNCAPKSSRDNRTRSCVTCLMIIDQRTTDEQLRSIRTKHLRAYAIHSRIQIEFLLEKQDLINCIQQQKRGRFFFPQSSSNNQDQQVRFNGSSPVKVLKPRVTLEELSSLESMDDLSVGQLKEILQENFVSMKGCLEKKELIEKVRLLYHDRNQSSENNSSDENLCKVCWDAIIDCVFLDCGHLCTCIQCGKQLSQCPICRSYIVRLVRVFKS